MQDRDINRALNELERQEVALLSWGIVDGGSTYEEILDCLVMYLGASRDDAESVLSILFDRKLIMPFDVGSGREVWRTRAAETVRLAANLRQLFPRHFEGDGGWRQAPGLVADFRFTVRPRQYPLRHLGIDKVVEALNAVTALSSLQRRALEVLVGDLQLSDFQVAATQRLFSDAESRTGRGLIIGAGTGTGKTLAFYLPAFLKVVESAAADTRNWVRVVALYPRIELLKDQLTTALGYILRLNAELKERGARPLTIGAFYGDTPYGIRNGAIDSSGKWQETGEGWVCPYLRDPRTNSALVWRKADVSAGRERLYVEGGGDLVADERVVRLTRNSMVENLPDFVFATTEMLQRAMGSATNAALFGIRAIRQPELVLLDEAHTYSGNTGAQVAYLLRRYRHALSMRSSTHFTGLSATLANAIPFFADLVGLPEHAVSYIRADEAAYPQDQAGHEYLLALRGDPFSGAGLLSTTIQTVALMRRILDPRSSELNAAISRGLVGQRVFVFTDDLDVTNRLYDDIADAEGLQRRWGVYRSNPKREPLAALRSPIREEGEFELFQDGQSWRLAGMVGHRGDLTERLELDRVSSQDAGINHKADIVVATASLEVGFDDDFVGAVVQHKAPHNVAQFLQRKGRAGRPQEMRPWTVVILSDYGRDRAAYQNYDALFDPEVQPQYLPLRNRYILRMQAASALVDWAANEVLKGNGGNRSPHMDPYRALTGATENRYVVLDQEAFCRVLSQVIDDPQGSYAKGLYNHIAKALAVTDDEADALLWEPPRAIMTGALPALLRRLERKFNREGTSPEPKSRHLLPEYIPENLFSDLNLPEVTLHIPPGDDSQMMPVDRALREYAAGRVSRRFGHADSEARHWIPVPTDGATVTAVALDGSVGDSPRVEGDSLGDYRYTDTGGIDQAIPVLRPYHIRLEQTADEVTTSSHATPLWHTQIICSLQDVLGSESRFAVSSRLSWSQVVKEVRFYTHLNHYPVEVRRFTTGADARILVRERGTQEYTKHRIQVNYTINSEPAALGFSQYVDGIAFVVCPPTPEVILETMDDEVRRSQRTAYLQFLISEKADLGELDDFQRGWLYLAVAGTITILTQEGYTPQNIDTPEKKALFKSRLEEVLSRILELDIDPESEDVERGRNAEALIASLEEDSTVSSIIITVAKAWDLEAEGFHAWLRDRIRVTLGTALLRACAEATPGRSEEGLLLDLEAGPIETDEEEDVYSGIEDIIWITERTVGGNGLVEAIQRAYLSDPRAFFGAVDRALQESDLELVAAELPRAVRMITTDSEVSEAATATRNAVGLEEATRAHAALRDNLTRRGIMCTHAVYAALTHRLLRPGSDDSTAVLIGALVKKWKELEADSGIEVDMRVFSYLAANDASISDLLAGMPAGYQEDPVWRASIYYSLLWARGVGFRSTALRPNNSYVVFPPTDRLLLRDTLLTRGESININDSDWKDRLGDSLGLYGEAYLETTVDGTADLSQAILNLAEIPLEAGYLHVFPRVVDVERTMEGYRAHLLLPEALQ